MDLLARYILQEALQVAEVEADTQTRTSLLTGAGDRLLSCDREVKVLTRDTDRIISEVEDHEAAGTVREERDALRSEEELILVDDDIVYRAGGDDGVVVGELPFEETCRERAAGHREAGIAPVEADGYFACFLREDPAGQELCDTSGEAEGCRLTALDVGVGVAHEDAAVGGYRDELLGVEVEIDPRHDGACVVIAGSVEGALETLQ